MKCWDIKKCGNNADYFEVAIDKEFNFSYACPLCRECVRFYKYHIAEGYGGIYFIDLETMEIIEKKERK